MTASGVHTVRTPQLGECQLQPHGHRLHLRIPADRQAVGENLLQGETDVLDEQRLQPGDRLGEHGLVDQQLLTHSGPVRSLTRVHEHGSRTARTLVRARDPVPRRTSGECREPGGSLSGVPCADCGEHRMVRAVVVQRVGDVEQRHAGAVSGHPFRQRFGRRRDPLLGLARNHERRNRRILLWCCGYRIRSLLDHHMSVRPAEAERRHTRTARSFDGRPLAILRDDLERS